MPMFVSTLVSVSLLPLFEIWRRTGSFLLLLNWAFPGLIRLFGVFRIGRLAGIVFGGLFAHLMLPVKATPRVRAGSLLPS
jgi:hypothetical protein